MLVFCISHLFILQPLSCCVFALGEPFDVLDYAQLWGCFDPFLSLIFLPNLLNLSAEMTLGAVTLATWLGAGRPLYFAILKLPRCLLDAKSRLVFVELGISN